MGKERLKKLEEIIGNRRIAVVGLGNRDRADDGFGLRIAEALKSEFPDRVFLETDGMEEIVDTINRREEIALVIFVDTVSANEKSGVILIIEREEIEVATSSHKIPLKLYLSLLKKPSYLIGIQPKCLDFMKPVSREIEEGIQETTKVLSTLLKNSL